MKKNLLQELAKKRYLERLKSLPALREKRTQAYINLAFTLAALSFFGLFAINPTVSTIINLRKQIEDSRHVDQQLAKKISDLTILQQKYNELQPDLPLILTSLPEKPQSTYLLGQIQSIVTKHTVQISSLASNEVQLSKREEAAEGELTFDFTLGITGSYENLSNFLATLSNFDRIVSLQSVTISRDTENAQNRNMTITGTAYYYPNL
jgi:Tfp pilus assembly protein PilO